jgi:hypothetical protein
MHSDRSTFAISSSSVPGNPRSIVMPVAALCLASIGCCDGCRVVTSALRVTELSVDEGLHRCCQPFPKVPWIVLLYTFVRSQE